MVLVILKSYEPKGRYMEYAADGTFGKLTDSLGDTTRTFDMSVICSTGNGKKSYYNFHIINGINNKFVPINMACPWEQSSHVREHFDVVLNAISENV